MATYTTNLDLIKPAGTDKIRIAQINENMDTLDAAIGAVRNTSLQTQVSGNTAAIANVQNGLAYIVGNTNTTGGTLAVGQFVYVKGHSTIPEGLRKVTSSISANGSITTSNTDACSEGGLNALNSNLGKTSTDQISNVTVNTTNAEWAEMARSLFKRNGICFLNCGIKIKLESYNTYINCATLPPEYRPKAIVEFTQPSPIGSGKKVNYRLNTDGVLSIRPEEQMNGWTHAIYCAYLAN
jgi:hypothetical protein